MPDKSRETWKDLLFTSFGLQDKMFALHTEEKKNAAAMLEEAARQNVSLLQIEAEARSILKDWPDDHVVKQLTVLRKMYAVRAN